MSNGGRKAAVPRYAIDIIVSVVLAYGITWFVMDLHQGGVGAGAVYIIALLSGMQHILPYAGAMALGLCGLLCRRPGLITGAVLVGAAYFLVDTAEQQLDRARRRADYDEVARLATETLAPASRSHEVLAIDARNTVCSDNCRQVIARTSRTLAIKDRQANHWVIWRRGEGDACASQEHAQSALEFLLAGYPGMCLVKTTARDIPDALVFREGSVSEGRQLPRHFSGSVYEISERIGGEEHLLGRRLSGGIGSPPFYKFAGFTGIFRAPADAVELGPRIEFKDFLAAASGISADELSARHTAPLAETLDQVESYFDRANVGSLAAWTWRSVASRERERSNVWRPRVERMLASDDPVRIGVALEALFNLPPAERDAHQDRFVELAFSPLTGMKDSPIPGPLRGHLRSPAAPFPAEIRTRARARFVDDAGLTQEQRQIFFMLMVRGGPAMREEAVEALLALPGERLADAVWALRTGESQIWAGSQPDRWRPEERDRLLARITSVPDAGLERFIEALRYGGSLSDEQKQRLVEHLRERLNHARDAQFERRLRLLIETAGR